jgi:hypothetical protein
LRNIKGYKKPLSTPGEGDTVVDTSPSKPLRESLLPEMEEAPTELITKDEVD